MIKTMQDAPACLNTNDKAMWVVGYNEAVTALKNPEMLDLEQAYNELRKQHEEDVALLRDIDRCLGYGVWMDVGKARVLVANRMEKE